MRVPRIYSDHPISGKTYSITGRAFHHLKHVLRIKTERQITLFDGQGGEYSAVVTGINKDSIDCEIKSFEDISRESGFYLEIAIPLVARDKLEIAIQKAVELGAHKISLIQFERSTYKVPSEKIQNKMSHLVGIIIGASEQSGRTRIPSLEKPCRLEDWAHVPFDGLSCFLHVKGEHAFPDDDYTKSRVTFGPEGGLTEDEYQLLIEKGFMAFSLGPRILRSETACISASTLLQYQYGDLSERKIL